MIVIVVKDQRVLCPLSGRPLKIKELMPVKFTEMPEDSNNKKLIARKVRYMCPVTHDALTNTTRCAYLKTRFSPNLYSFVFTGSKPEVYFLDSAHFSARQ